MNKTRFIVRMNQRNVDPYYVEVVAIAVLIVANSLASTVPTAALFLGVCETLYLVYALLAKSMEDFTILLLVLLSANIENALFALGDRQAVLYSMYHLPVVRGYQNLLILAAAWIKFCKKKPFSIFVFRANNGYGKFVSLNMLLAVMAVPMAVFTLLTNDNGMLVHTDMWRYMARDGYQMVYIIVIVCLVCGSLAKNRAFIDRVKNTATAILSAATWAAVILVICGNYYNKWGNEYYLTCPLILFFSPGLLLFLFERHGLFHLVTGSVAFALQLRYTVGIAGTWWLYVFGVGVLLIRKIAAVEKNAIRRKLLIKMAAIVLAAGAFIIVAKSEMFHTISGQVTYKLSRILSIFRNADGLRAGYYEAGGSIQARIEEIVSALIEIAAKPQFWIFGKGYGGTVLNHWGSSNWSIPGSTFADPMIKYQVFSAFHISVAEIIVNFGLVGIALIVFLVKEFIVEFFKKDGSSFLMLGCMWFLFFYSLYYSLNLGLVWLCCGLYMKYNTERR